MSTTTLCAPLTEEPVLHHDPKKQPVPRYDPKKHKSSYSELSNALGQGSGRETRKETITRSHFTFTTPPSVVMHVPTSKAERDASVLQVNSPWEYAVKLAYNEPGLTTLDDQMVSPAKRCMIPF